MTQEQGWDEEHEERSDEQMTGTGEPDTGWRPNFPVARRVSMQDEARRLVVELTWLVSRETSPGSTRPMRQAARELRQETLKRLENVLGDLRGVERKEALPEGALGLSVGQLQERYEALRREYSDVAARYRRSQTTEGGARMLEITWQMHKIHEVLYRIAARGWEDFEHVVTTIK